jgi:hypothetical protein
VATIEPLSAATTNVAAIWPNSGHYFVAVNELSNFLFFYFSPLNSGHSEPSLAATCRVAAI